MSRIKQAMVSVLAIAFVGAFASASASAHRFIEEGPKEVKNGEKITGTSGVSELASTIDKVAITIVCKKDKFEGTLETGGKTKATITYEECSLTGLSGCKVPNIIAKVNDKLIENAGKEIEDEFEQEGTEPFATIEIETCTLKGKYKVTGTQKCALPKGKEFLVLHEIACATSGSNLKLASEKATYKGTASVEMASKNKWAVE